MSASLPKTIKEARDALSSGHVSPEEIISEARRAAKEKNPDVNAYLEIFNLESSSNENGPLGNIPIAVKDNILIKGKHAGAASKILENYVAPYDATVIRKLRDAGAVFIGRTNMDEFAMGSSTENSAFGVTKNPLDMSRVPGGSSGGSAAALLIGGALGAIGSDTGGSIRQPASFCGLVGLKPTYGAVSRFGLIAMASSLDQIGSITKTVDDAEIMFGVLRGKDPLDATSQDAIPEKDTSSYKKKIGIPRALLEEEGIEKDVKDVFEKTVREMKRQGYEIMDIELPNAHLALSVYYIIMPAEVSSNLARFDGVRFGFHADGETVLDEYLKTRAGGFGEEALRRILLGTFVLSSGYYDAYYKTAMTIRNTIRDEFSDAFEKVSAIITPTTPTPAFKIGEKTKDPLAMYYSDILTVPANITGVPALSVPSGFVTRDNVALPLGLQIMAPHFHEDILFSIGRDVESIT